MVYNHKEYMQVWNVENKDKVSEAMKKYRASEKGLQTRKDYNNKESTKTKIKESTKTYNEKNRERINENMRQRRLKKKEENG